MKTAMMMIFCGVLMVMVGCEEKSHPTGSQYQPKRVGIKVEDINAESYKYLENNYPSHEHADRIEAVNIYNEREYGYTNEANSSGGAIQAYKEALAQLAEMNKKQRDAIYKMMMEKYYDDVVIAKTKRADERKKERESGGGTSLHDLIKNRADIPE